MGIYTILIIWILAIACQTVKTSQNPEWLKVTEVVDGDTFHG